MDNAEQLAINWDLNDTGYRGSSKSERHHLRVEKSFLKLLARVEVFNCYRALHETSNN